MENINRKSNGVELKSMKIDCHEAGLLGIPDENSDNKQHNTEKQSTEKTCNGTPEKNVSAQTNIDIVDIDDEKDEKLQDPLSVKTKEHESDHDNEDDDDVGLDGLYSASASSEKINGQAPISKRLCVYLLGCVLAGVLLVVIVMLNITDKPESTSTDTFFDEDIDRDPSSWALWTDWSQCSLTCGTGNTTRYRTLDRHAEYVGDGSGGIEILRQTEIEECLLKSCPVDGGLSQWAPWSLCSSDCGPGIQIRHRECTDPIPKHGGRNCTGKTQVTRKCLLKPCPVDGGFTLWSSWSVCSVTCGTGLKSRDRTCSNPPPQYSGVPCTGPVQDTELCGGTRCPVHGAFSLWSDWTLCTVSCGTGIQTRRRACDNPPPADGGWDCAGRRFEKQTCTLPECPVDGDWAAWSKWTQCTWSCGSGLRYRARSCTDPSPQQGGQTCTGPSYETQDCSIQPCPVPQTTSPRGMWDQTNSLLTSTTSDSFSQSSTSVSRQVPEVTPSLSSPISIKTNPVSKATSTSVSSSTATGLTSTTAKTTAGTKPSTTIASPPSDTTEPKEVHLYTTQSSSTSRQTNFKETSASSSTLTSQTHLH